MRNEENKKGVKLVLISKGIRVEKICNSDYEEYIFERDMPAKHNLLFSKTPYAIQRKVLN